MRALQHCKKKRSGCRINLDPALQTKTRPVHQSDVRMNMSASTCASKSCQTWKTQSRHVRSCLNKIIHTHLLHQNQQFQQTQRWHQMPRPKHCNKPPPIVSNVSHCFNLVSNQTLCGSAHEMGGFGVILLKGLIRPFLLSFHSRTPQER